MKNPPHPGRIIRQECLTPLGLSVTAAARAWRGAADTEQSGQREVRYFPGNGDQAGKGVRQFRRNVVRLADGI